MGIIGSILLVLFLGDFLWWWRADHVLRRLPGNGPWRLALGVFMAAQAVGLGLVLLDRRFDLSLDGILTGPWLTIIYLWHCLLLFPMLLLWIPYALARGIVTGVRRVLENHDTRRIEPRPADPYSLTRRDFARLLGTALPALTTVGAAAIALWQIERFRIRRLTIALPDLPAALDGHTHGGQLMVTPDLGFGPMLYRYWSGLYRQAGRALVVSNGTGNWFPLRTRAPAEIIHLTLRRENGESAGA